MSFTKSSCKVSPPGVLLNPSPLRSHTDPIKLYNMPWILPLPWTATAALAWTARSSCGSWNGAFKSRKREHFNSLLTILQQLPTVPRTHCLFLTTPGLGPAHQFLPLLDAAVRGFPFHMHAPVAFLCPRPGKPPLLKTSVVIFCLECSCPSLCRAPRSFLVIQTPT